MNYEWEPTNRLRWVIRHGEQVLQQLCNEQNPKMDFGGTPIIQEWRDVTIEVVEEDTEREKYMSCLGVPSWQVNPETDTVKLMWQKVDEARLEKAQSEIERLKKEAGMLTEEAEEYYINMNKANKENYRLREALQEIADKGGAWSKEIARRALRNND